VSLFIQQSIYNVRARAQLSYVINSQVQRYDNFVKLDTFSGKNLPVRQANVRSEIVPPYFLLLSFVFVVMKLCFCSFPTDFFMFSAPRTYVSAPETCVSGAETHVSAPRNIKFATA
jgi:hypothetical protein